MTGNLALNANALTINVTGPALAVGTYRLLDCGSTLSGSANPVPTIAGTPLASGCTASISTSAGSAGHVDLVVKATSTFANLAASQSATYGAPSIMLGGTVSAAGPLYPAMGETIGVTVNGNTQTTTVNDATGDFSLNYNPSTLPAGGAPYSITYSYAGDASLNGATNATTTLTVNRRPVILTGTRPYDGTAAAAAAILSVTNTVGIDVVTVASGSGTLESADYGPEALSSPGTLMLGGPAAGNYTLTGASGSVTITLPPFSITAEYVDNTGTNFVITWDSVPGAPYHLVGNTDVTAALNTWTNVGGSVIATSTSTSVTNPIASPMEFFHVKSP